jgi:hypothetical protein
LDPKTFVTFQAILAVAYSFSRHLVNSSIPGYNSVIILRTLKIGKGFFNFKGGLRGRVVKVVDLRSQVPHHCRFDPHSGRNLSCEEAIQLAYGRSVVLPRCPLVPEIMPEGTFGVFLHQ